VKRNQRNSGGAIVPLASHPNATPMPNIPIISYYLNHHFKSRIIINDLYQSFRLVN